MAEPFGWVEAALDPGWVLEVDSPDELPGWVEVTVPGVGVPSSAVTEVLSVGFVEPPVGSFGLAPPTLITVEMPPVARGGGLTGTVTVLDNTVWGSASVVPGSSAGCGVARARGGAMITGEETAGGSTAESLAGAAGAREADGWAGATLTTCARW